MIRPLVYLVLALVVFAAVVEVALEIRGELKRRRHWANYQGYRAPGSNPTRVGVRANWRQVAAWLWLPLASAALLWWMVWVVVQVACAGAGSVRV